MNHDSQRPRIVIDDAVITDLGQVVAARRAGLPAPTGPTDPDTLLDLAEEYTQRARTELQRGRRDMADFYATRGEQLLQSYADTRTRLDGPKLADEAEQYLRTLT